MQTIIVCDGLTRDVLSPELHYQSNNVNVGRREIARLVGSGRQYGQGPLPRFLELAAEQVRLKDASTHLLFLVDVNAAKTSDTEAGCNIKQVLIDPFDKIAADAALVTCVPAQMPWVQIQAQIRDVVSKEEQVRILIVGCHTDGRVLSTALVLRNVLGYSDVAVCAHLVGSSTQEAHYAALRHHLPLAGVRIFLDLGEAAAFAGLDAKRVEQFNLQPCIIEPREVREALSTEQSRIIELLCCHWTKTHLRSLQGGYSGSLLFLADGWQGTARTEPMVIKIDARAQMRREIEGYHRVKDFVGKHVPSFGYPVSLRDHIGVGMELAAMEGQPETLQDHFEAAENELALKHFTNRLEKVLGQLSEKLYRNTLFRASVVPYREFGLHIKDQLLWLDENGKHITEYVEAERIKDAGIDVRQTQTMLSLIASNEDGIESEVCIAHGDLNLKNIICDQAENIWFIDWTHAGEYPLELDFAKLENDVKFVMSKDFEHDDLPRLRRFEDYLLNHRLPDAPDNLPSELKFVKWDLRYRKILAAVNLIRRKCFDLKVGDGWLIYQVALLKYALHTLSFDARRNRGECKLIQLIYALYSAGTLCFKLVTDDFHLRIRGERPASYPARQRISIDQAPWSVEVGNYDPPYHVDGDVLENDRHLQNGGWADPEDTRLLGGDVSTGESQRADDLGRPLNPRGRTGIAGRGMLGGWGANPAVGAVVTRSTGESNPIEILVGRREGQTILSLPRGFLFSGETAEQAMSRIALSKVGCQIDFDEEDVMFDGFYYDVRQTDHAWVELRAYLITPKREFRAPVLRSTDAFSEVEWRPLVADTINVISSSGARLVREAVSRLRDAGAMPEAEATRLLERTG